MARSQKSSVKTESDVQPAAPDMVAPVSKRPRLGLRRKVTSCYRQLTAQTRAYIAEYAVQLLLTGALITSVHSLIGEVASSFKHTAAHWTDSWQYMFGMAQLAAVVVMIPLLIVLSRRIAGTETAVPKVVSGGWRKAFLGIFLVYVGLSAVGYGVALVYALISWLGQIGLGTSGGTPDVAMVVSFAFGVLLYGLTTFVYARGYRSQDVSTVSRRLHRYGLVVVALVVAVLYVVLPMQKQRGAYVDSLIVRDMQTIQSAISNATYSNYSKYDYRQSQNELPKDLQSLQLPADTKQRINSLKYEYKPGKGGEYKLCATFRTDASQQEKQGGGIIPMPYAAGASLSSAYPDYSDKKDTPEHHRKGYQCFDFSEYGVGIAEPAYDLMDKNAPTNYQSDTYMDMQGGSQY